MGEDSLDIAESGINRWHFLFQIPKLGFLIPKLGFLILMCSPVSDSQNFQRDIYARVAILSAAIVLLDCQSEKSSFRQH
jgi:hypothetical protein